MSIHSDKYGRIVDFFRKYQTEHHYPPTVREVMAEFDISSTSVARAILDRLVVSGVLCQGDAGTARSFHVELTYTANPLEVSASLLAVRGSVSDPAAQEQLFNAALDAMPSDYRRAYEIAIQLNRGQIADIATESEFPKIKTNVLVQHMVSIGLLRKERVRLNGAERTIVVPQLSRLYSCEVVPS